VVYSCKLEFSLYSTVFSTGGRRSTVFGTGGRRSALFIRRYSERRYKIIFGATASAGTKKIFGATASAGTKKAGFKDLEDFNSSGMNRIIGIFLP